MREYLARMGRIGLWLWVVLRCTNTYIWDCLMMPFMSRNRIIPIFYN